MFRIKIPALFLSFSFLMAASAVVHAADIDVFILAGQSNMEGQRGDGAHYPPDPSGWDQKIKFYWASPGNGSSNGRWTTLQPQTGLYPRGHFGPEVSFARKLAQDGRPIALFKYSRGGTSLMWDWKKPGQGGLYDGMTAELKKALGQLERDGFHPVIRAFVWIQGESDSQNRAISKEYSQRLALLIENIRSNIANNENLPILLGLDEQHPAVKDNPQVLEMQKKFAKDHAHVIFTSMLGLQKADSTHLTPQGLEAHGLRLYEAYKKLVN